MGKSKIIITKRQRDKEGNIWLRDNYGGWTNQYGVRFTKTEHRRFGYEIRKANKRITEYNQKYPSNRITKQTDLGSRLRSSDLARFRRKSAYTNYLRVSKGISSGKYLYQRNPIQYRNNLIKAMNQPNFQATIKQLGMTKEFSRLINKLKSLSGDQLIRLSRDLTTPDINIYYVNIGSIQKSNFKALQNAIENVV